MCTFLYQNFYFYDLKIVCFRDFAKMSSRLVSNWIITVAIAQIPEGMLTNLNDLYYEGTQGYYDVSLKLCYISYVI